ncbi:MFS transporter [Actinocatenispora rupis]|uniref:MFS transporter n=1 Tax=Actinocatenispora rupis TaxID=519421 RepID=A0A8J3JFD8_9ACTN|nr:MFS transporter [Actinocatenispora rupis]GID15432.1 MFS transporter [Actinocatenispora rupis]
MTTVQTPARPLAYRNFRLLVIGAGTSSFGNSITPVALAFAVLALGGSTTQLGLVVAAYALADVATALFGGVLGDRLPRAAMMQGSAIAAAAAQALVAASLVGGWSSVWLLGAVGAVTGCLGALAAPSSSAMTRQTVPEPLLRKAVTQRRLTQNGAQIVGFAVAGVLAAGIGPGWAIAVDAATFAVAAVCYHLLRVPEPVRERAESMLHDLGAGLREVLRHSWLWMLILQALLYHLFYGGVQGVLGPVVVSATWNKATWGWALSALMIGFLAGGLLSLRWRPRRGLFQGTLLLALTGCFPAAMALGVPGTAGLLLLLGGAFLHGLGLELFSVSWDLSIQQNVPEDKLARVYSFDMVGSFVARPVGLALTGPVAALTGTTTWLWVCAAVMAGGSLLAATLPSVRQLHRHDPAPADEEPEPVASGA